MKVLDEFPVKVELTVNWGEMDAYGHINNTNYFKYFETSRIRYMQTIGFYECFQSQGIAGVLAKATCQFIAPLRFPDTLSVCSRVIEIGVDRIVMEHFVASSQMGLAAIGDSELAIFDFKKNKRISVPDFLKKSIEKLEKRSF